MLITVALQRDYMGFKAGVTLDSMPPADFKMEFEGISRPFVENRENTHMGAGY